MEIIEHGKTYLSTPVRDAFACLWRAKLTVTRMIWVEKIG